MGVALCIRQTQIFFGIGELRVAQHLQRHPVTRRGLVVRSLCEVVLGVALVCGWMMSSEEIASLLGLTAILSILQLLPFFFTNARTPVCNWDERPFERRRLAGGL